MKGGLMLMVLLLLFTLLWRTGLLLVMVTQTQDCEGLRMEVERLTRDLAFERSKGRAAGQQQKKQEREDDLKALKSGGGPLESECRLSSLFTRMHRIHLLFNEDQRLVSDVIWESEIHAGLAIREEAFHFMQRNHHLESKANLEGVHFLAAEWWQDFSFGLQYLLTLRQPGPENQVLQLRVIDDRRFQLQVFEDPDPSSRITVILALYNRGKQLQSWVKSLAAIPKDLRENVRLCLADFGSQDVKVEELLAQSELPFELFELEGTFSKTDALNHCLNWISDDNEIVFTTDVDVILPNNVFKKIRRYTRKGVQVYAPIVLYQTCTWTTGDCWADGGYGLVSYFKSDAKAIGLYDNERFNFREGFEDTDFLLRLLRKPLLVVRKRERGFFHLDHERSAWAEVKNRGKLQEVFEPLIC